MTLLDAITAFDNARPNSFEFKTKRTWVLSLETDIRRFAYLHTNKDAHMEFLNKENPTLFLDDSKLDIYVFYLISMADITNGEYRLYNISSTYFNSIFGKWKKEYRAKNKPETGTYIKV